MMKLRVFAWFLICTVYLCTKCDAGCYLPHMQTTTQEPLTTTAESFTTIIAQSTTTFELISGLSGPSSITTALLSSTNQPCENNSYDKLSNKRAKFVNSQEKRSFANVYCQFYGGSLLRVNDVSNVNYVVSKLADGSRAYVSYRL